MLIMAFHVQNYVQQFIIVNWAVSQDNQMSSGIGSGKTINLVCSTTETS